MLDIPVLCFFFHTISHTDKHTELPSGQPILKIPWTGNKETTFFAFLLHFFHGQIIFKKLLNTIESQVIPIVKYICRNKSLDIDAIPSEVLGEMTEMIRRTQPRASDNSQFIFTWRTWNRKETFLSKYRFFKVLPLHKYK